VTVDDEMVEGVADVDVVDGDDVADVGVDADADEGRKRDQMTPLKDEKVLRYPSPVAGSTLGPGCLTAWDLTVDHQGREGHCYYSSC